MKLPPASTPVPAYTPPTGSPLGANAKEVLLTQTSAIAAKVTVGGVVIVTTKVLNANAGL